MPLAGIGSQRFGEQGTNTPAVSIQSHRRARKSGEQRCALRKDAKSGLELFFSVLNMIDSKKREPIAEPCSRIVGRNVNGVFMERQRILPNIIVADAQKR